MTPQQLYRTLMQKSGQSCYTLSHNNEAEMVVEHDKITIIYKSGGTTILPREMVEKAIDMLIKQGTLSVEDVHEGITNRQGAKTDRLSPC